MNSTYGKESSVYDKLIFMDYNALGYVDELFAQVFKCMTDQTMTVEMDHAPPSPLSSSFDHPDKSETIMKHQS